MHLQDAKLEFITLHDFLSKHITTDAFGKNIIQLEFEGYIDLNRDAPKEIYVTITKKGKSAYMSNYFIEKNHEIVIKRVVDFIMGFCNLGLFIIAFIAITNSNDEKIKNMQERLLMIEKEVLKRHTELPTNLDTQTNKNIGEKRNADSSMYKDTNLLHVDTIK